MASLSYLPFSTALSSKVPSSSSSSSSSRSSQSLSPSCTSSAAACFSHPSESQKKISRGLRDNWNHSFEGLGIASRCVSAKIVAASQLEPLKVMISGAPASGKGTQCEFITKKYGLVHISAGDLLRAEVAAGTENGKRAKEHMEKGLLVPNEIVVLMVKERLRQPDCQEKGWLLDGYPRSFSQAQALVELQIRPDIFILLDVPEEILVERVVGRRLDPVTGKIYHLKYFPPENEEIAARLTHRFDDTEEKVKLRLQTHHHNVGAVLSMYKDVMFKVDGDLPKEDVFAQIDDALSSFLERPTIAAGVAS